MFGGKEVGGSKAGEVGRMVASETGGVVLVVVVESVRECNSVAATMIRETRRAMSGRAMRAE